MYGEIIFFILIFYYGNYLYSLFTNGNREAVKDKNTKMDKLRQKKFKTIKQQKEFVNYVRPKWDIKINFAFFKGLVFGLVKFLIFYNIFLWLLSLINLRIGFMFSILSWVVIPLAINYILSKYKLQDNNMLEIMRWK